MTMERKIGEIFEYNGEWYQVVECSKDNYPCIGCCGCKGVGGARIFGGECNGNARKDRRFVIFKKLEKAGEPYEDDGHIFQEYHVFEEPIFTEKYATFGVNSKISIEIKQNKKDMEGRELDPHMAKVIDEATQKMGEEIGRQIRENINKQRMKPFSLEAAKAGKPVCTRDGAKARIICFDAKSDAPIIALITTDDGTEIAFDYLSDGTFFNSENPDNDLMMLPEKKEGWVNIYKEGVDQYIYNNEKAASSRRGSDCIATIKIEWEE